MAEHDGELIADIKKNQREVLRISRREFKGRWMVDFRIMFYDTEGALRLGKGGFGIDETAIPQIIAALSAPNSCPAGGSTT